MHRHRKLAAQVIPFAAEDRVRLDVHGHVEVARPGRRAARRGRGPAARSRSPSATPGGTGIAVASLRTVRPWPGADRAR